MTLAHTATVQGVQRMYCFNNVCKLSSFPSPIFEITLPLESLSVRQASAPQRCHRGATGVARPATAATRGFDAARTGFSRENRSCCESLVGGSGSSVDGSGRPMAPAQVQRRCYPPKCLYQYYAGDIYSSLSLSYRCTPKDLKSCSP